MELPETVSVRKFREFNAKQKEELYKTLLELSESIQELPKKSLRKTLELTLGVLAYKGKQVEEWLQRQADAPGNERRLTVENDKLKDMLASLQDEQEAHKSKIKTLTEEIVQLQQRLQEAVERGEASDKDSSDPLSELDKKEELLRNINAKNKHIKRLLRDMEQLQNQNIEQAKTIARTDTELQDLREKLMQLSKDITLMDNERKQLLERVQEQSVEITRLEGNINYLEEERDKTELETKQLVQKFESKLLTCKKLLEQRDKELKQLREGTIASGQTSSTTHSSNNTTTAESEASASTEEAEMTKLHHLLEVREQKIEKLESKIRMLGEDMLASTKLMNQLSAERAQQCNADSKQPRACCKTIEDNLRATNERCQQLSELLERTEEDNLLKSQQALQAITALEAYKQGKDGLVVALQKCAALEQKLQAREKKLRAYVIELNSMHEVIEENRVLRKRLKIPDDEVVTAKNLIAKDRKKDKLIERLTLKLRTSEEMRLQLKLEKCQLRKEILAFQQCLQKGSMQNESSPGQSLPSEIGEVPDSSPTEYTHSHMCGLCRGQGDGAASTELQTKYEEVLAENEALRAGMYEILEKLREYDAASDHITIDTALLKQLISILPNRQISPIDTPKRLQLQVLELKAREKALRELLQQQSSLPSEASEASAETGELSSSSVQSLRDVPDMPREHVEHGQDMDIAEQQLDTATRPTTPDTALPRKIILPEILPTAEARELEQEIVALRIYRKNYEELKQHMAVDGNELKQRNQDLVTRLTKLEIGLQQQNKSYEYMRVDYDKLLTDMKHQELRYISDTAELKRQLNERLLELEQLRARHETVWEKNKYSTEEYQQLEKRCLTLSMQLAFVVGEVLAGKDDDGKLMFRDICVDYGVIQDNYQLEYITADEYEKQRDVLRTWKDKQLILERKNQQLEGLLEVANEQIQSLQRLLNEITNNHINLRHFVADLQSNNEEKLLLAKIQRDLDSAKSEVVRIEMERNELQSSVTLLRAQLKEAQQLAEEAQKDFQNERNNKEVKIKFLQKSLFALREKYIKFTPLIFLNNFVFAYTKFLNKQTEIIQDTTLPEMLLQQIETTVATRLAEHNLSADESQQMIKLIRAESHTKMLEAQLESLQLKYAEQKRELNEMRLKHATESEHWQTIEALFSQSAINSVDSSRQLTNHLHDMAVNTEAPTQPVPALRTRTAVELIDKQTSPIATPTRGKMAGAATADKQTSPIVTPTRNKTPEKATVETPSCESRHQTSAVAIDCAEIAIQTTALQHISTAVQTNGRRELASQAVQTCVPETPNSDAHVPLTELQQMQTALGDANKRIAELERLQESANTTHTSTSEEEEKVETTKVDSVEKTILSFHALLMEKDNSINKYQDLLQTERGQSQFTITKLNTENDTLRSTVNNLNFTIKTKDVEILELKAKVEVLSLQQRADKSCRAKTGDGDAATHMDSDESGDNSLNELTDEKIEEMFEDTAGPMDKQVTETEKQDTEELKELPTLHKQNKELKDKVAYYESTLQAKDEEINVIKEKLKLFEENEKAAEVQPNPTELEQLRAYLEEKDKHINDLMETLKNFHDDQQLYINDTSTYSADQIAKLASDLNRIEATNKIYQTQVEALRRQVTNLTQREKQARELNQSLRNQLIKRPVVSIKTELNARVKNENLQKRIQQLETELDEARRQMQRQQTLLDAKRARSANEVGLWEKQKRWQQNAEKCKAKLEETEAALEKTRNLLQAARTTIARLEKDKQSMEVKLHKATSHPATARSTNNSNVDNMKCCRTPSCPNLQHVGAKFTPSPSESPETYTGASSECSSPAHRAQHSFFDSNQPELIEALKARIELQQRKIIAMELEGKGTNALTTELEKLQERCQALEAQNIRLEARNLQLQLDTDMLRQVDASDRMQKRIKHLEDYIIALKEEMARMDSRRDLCKCSGVRVNTQQGQSAEQTILSLRNLVEKLRAENKYLKDGRRSTESRSSSDSAADNGRLQQMYTDAMERVNTLQQELETKMKCSICHGRTKEALNEELKFIKEQLIKKTQLLQKAKVLLTRAAAKEKVLKEQLILWKRKCSELQNVPVIEEISE